MKERTNHNESKKESTLDRVKQRIMMTTEITMFSSRQKKNIYRFVVRRFVLSKSSSRAAAVQKAF